MNFDTTLGFAGPSGGWHECGMPADLQRAEQRIESALKARAQRYRSLAKLVDPNLVAEVEACAQELDAMVEALKRAGFPSIEGNC